MFMYEVYSKDMYTALYSLSWFLQQYEMPISRVHYQRTVMNTVAESYHGPSFSTWLQVRKASTVRVLLNEVLHSNLPFQLGIVLI